MAQKRTFEFTDRGLRGLPLPPKPQQLDYFDTKERGLGLRVSYGGRRAFFVMYSDARGKRQRVTLGEYGKYGGKLTLADARKKAKVKLGAMAQDRDPAVEARAERQAPTVATLAADFIAAQRREKRKRVGDQEKMLARDVLPVLGDRKARDVNRADIKRIMRTITDRGAPIMANRTHEVIRALFNFAIEEETYAVETNPAARLRRYRTPETRRERWLTLPEIKAYWESLDHGGGSAADVLRLCLLTGQRQHNVLGMRTDQMHLADRIWLVPASTTKTERRYKVPLSNAAVRIIENRLAELTDIERRRAKRERRKVRPVTWLFPSRHGDRPAGRTFISRANSSACTRAGIEGYRPHDARHTFATHCDVMGIPRLVWDGIIHPPSEKNKSMADLYSSHDFADERLKCMEAWADRIAVALSENVVRLERA